MSIKELKRQYLQLSDETTSPINDFRVLSAKILCGMAMGKPADEKAFAIVLEPFYKREDCIDFAANIILRMLYLYHDGPLMSAELKNTLKELFLDLDYWFNVEKSPNSGIEIMWTENHVMLWHTCEYLLCQFYPEETFRGRKKKGREVLGILKPKLLHWMHVKAMVGFSEWDSNCYVAENYMSLLNLYDFVKDEELRIKAKDMLDLISFGMAVNTFKGVYGCTHGRTYVNQVIDCETESTRAIQKLLWGIGSYERNLVNIGAVTLALSGYESPEIIERIAKDLAGVVESKEQQSFLVEDGPKLGCGHDEEEDLTLYWQNMGYTHRDIIDRNVEIGERHNISIHDYLMSEYEYVRQCRVRGVLPELCRCRTYLPAVNKVTYKTGDYMLSCAQDFRKGERGFQQHIWQASLDGGVAVFTNHPGKLTDGAGRPDLWIGNDIFPRAVQYKNTLISIYRIDREVLVPYSHAYFPKESFDDVKCLENWIFARKGKGYIGLYSQNGFRWSVDGKYAGKELICDAKENIWICQLGNEAEYNNFESFVRCILSWKISSTGLAVSIVKPEGSRMEFGWDGPLTVDGEEIQIDGYKRFENKYCTTERYSGKYRIQMEDEVLELNFL